MGSKGDPLPTAAETFEIFAAMERDIDRKGLSACKRKCGIPSVHQPSIVKGACQNGRTFEAGGQNGRLFEAGGPNGRLFEAGGQNANARSTQSTGLLSKICLAPNSGNESCRADLCKIVAPTETTFGNDVCTDEISMSEPSPCGWFQPQLFANCAARKCRPLCHYSSGQGYLMSKPKRPGVHKKISSNTLHGIDSVNDLRSWSNCKDDRRKYFLEKMFPDGAFPDVFAFIC